MEVSYKKLWKLMIDQNVTSADLRKKTELSSCTMTKLRRNEPVTITALLKIADVLKCDISDMCEFTTTKEER